MHTVVVGVSYTGDRSRESSLHGSGVLQHSILEYAGAVAIANQMPNCSVASFRTRK